MTLLINDYDCGSLGSARNRKIKVSFPSKFLELHMDRCLIALDLARALGASRTDERMEASAIASNHIWTKMQAARA